MDLNQLSYDVIGCAIEVHRSLGPGLLESAYQECLYYLLRKEGFSVEKEKPMPVILRKLSLIVDIDLIFLWKTNWSLS